MLAIMKQDILEAILSKAILAPSADNSQPWKFRFRENAVDVMIDESRVHGFVSTGCLLPYASAGAVIENMRVAALYYGYQIQVDYFPDASNVMLAARIEFREAAPLLHSHYAVLHERCTNRSFFSPARPLPPSLYSNLAQIAEPEGFRFLWLEKSNPHYLQLRHLIGVSDELRFQVEQLHREFIACLRYEPGAEEGLPVSSLEAGPGAEGLFKAISSWGRMKLLNFFGFSRLMYRHAVKQMDSSQAAGILVGKSQSRESYVRGGEIMQRIWHEMTVEKVAMQPMEGLPVFIMNLQQGGMQNFTAAQREKVKEWKNSFFSLFKLTDENSLILLWRMGYAEPVRFRTARRKLASFMEK